MKKIKYLLVAFVMLFGFTLNTYALEYSVEYNKEVLAWNDEFLYDITIKSNDLSDNLELWVSNDESEFTYLSDEYQIYADTRCNYHFIDKTTHSKVELNDIELEILIRKDGLKEGTKYDVYYFDSFEHPNYVLDEVNIGDKAEVVKIDNELYIKLNTSILKPFVLEMEMSEKYKEELEKITENGIYSFPAVKPKNEVYTVFKAFETDNHNITIWPADKYQPENEYITLEFASISGETHIIKYKWKEETVPSHLKDKIEDIEESILKNTAPLDKVTTGREGVYFEIEDLNYINYLYNKSSETNEFDNVGGVVNYSYELKNVFKNNNLKYYFDFRAGNNEPFNNVAFGFMSLGYDGLIYSTNFEAGYYVKQVIYIPDNTNDTDKEYIEAAKKRIIDYLGTDDVQIEVAGTREYFTKDFNLVNEYRNVWKKYYDEKNLSDNCYKITVNGNSGYFVFEKNSKKIKEMEFKTKDLESDIEINTNSGSIPLDTLIEVDVIGKNHKEFKEILEILKKEDGMIYDLKLYSGTLSKYITKLDNGKFKVRIPLKDEFKNKKLKAYYITDKNDIEEYDITIEDGYAVFETSHFSTYTIAESGEIENPKTFDGISNNIIISVISFIGLCGTIYFLSRNNKSKSKI